MEYMTQSDMARMSAPWSSIVVQALLQTCLESAYSVFMLWIWSSGDWSCYLFKHRLNRSSSCRLLPYLNLLEHWSWDVWWQIQLLEALQTSMPSPGHQRSMLMAWYVSISLAMCSLLGSMEGHHCMEGHHEIPSLNIISILSKLILLWIANASWFWSRLWIK